MAKCKKFAAVLGLQECPCNGLDWPFCRLFYVVCVHVLLKYVVTSLYKVDFHVHRQIEFYVQKIGFPVPKLFFPSISISYSQWPIYLKYRLINNYTSIYQLLNDGIQPQVYLNHHYLKYHYTEDLFAESMIINFMGAALIGLTLVMPILLYSKFTDRNFR